MTSIGPLPFPGLVRMASSAPRENATKKNRLSGSIRVFMVAAMPEIGLLGVPMLGFEVYPNTEADPT